MLVNLAYASSSLLKEIFYLKKIRVLVYEKDERKKLLGPAAFNIIYAYKGNIIGIPLKDMDQVKKM